MSGMLAGKLTSWLAQNRNCVGEVRVEQTPKAYQLFHYLDSSNVDLTLFNDPEDALAIAKFDEHGKYRPLRSAPTLKRGWRLDLSTIQEVVQAFEYFYPAMLGTASAFEENRGKPINLRESLNRQSGMYRVAQKIGNVDADKVIQDVCPPEKCLKTITWKIDSEYPIRNLAGEKTDFSDILKRGCGFIPLPCEECCNILIAAIRESVKTALPAGKATVS